LGVGPDNMLAPINSPRPYGHGRASLVHRIAHALLEGTSASRRIFHPATNPFPSKPPRYVRVVLIALSPTSYSHATSTGHWWAETYLTEHLPAVLSLCASGAEGNGTAAGNGNGAAARNGNGTAVGATASDRVGVAPPPPPPPLSIGSRDPLLFHPDLMPVWRTRVPKLTSLLSAPLDLDLNLPAGRPRSAANASCQVATAAAKDTAQLAVSEFAAANQLSAPQLAEEFWSRFVPEVRAAGATAAWCKGEGLAAHSATLRSRWGDARLHAFELILGGVLLRLMPILESLHTTRRLERLGGAAPSYFHLVLLAHCLVLRGPLAAGSTLHRGSAITLLAATGEVPTDGAALPDELPEGEGDEGDPRSVEMAELASHGWSFYAMLWTDLLLFHARKHYVAHEIQRKYSKMMVHRHPCLLPGFLILLPELAEALKPLVWADHLPARFPQWVPPGPLGDWEPIAPVHAKAA